MSEWEKKQYSKIQDFVIYNKLYKGKPDNLSHADIVIDLAKKQLEAQPEVQADAECCAKCGGLIKGDSWHQVCGHCIERPA